jgi:hypothetical protein
MYKYQAIEVITDHSGIHLGKHAAIIAMGTQDISFRVFSVMIDKMFDFNLDRFIDSIEGVDEAKERMNNENEYQAVVVFRNKLHYSNIKPALLIIKE